MKNGKTLLFIVSVFLVFTTLIICVTADGVNQTTEIQGITTSTYIDVVGLATSSSDLAWTSSSGPTQTTVYSENTVAMNGHTVYVKDFSVNTGDQTAGSSNVQSSRQVTFEGYDGGNMVSDESLLIDTSGNATSAAGQYLCPFGASDSNVLPAFCNIIQAGSHVDSNYIAFSTQASSRTVMASADVPVALAYSINAHGINTANGTIDANGLVSAYMKMHLQEGSGSSLTKASDLTYQDQSSANGVIRSFGKSYTYQSGGNLL